MAKLLSIMPAQPGWFSVYRDDDGGTFEMPVALWALVEDEKNPDLRWPTSFSPSESDAAGMIQADDEDRNFAGYVFRPSSG